MPPWRIAHIGAYQWGGAMCEKHLGWLKVILSWKLTCPLPRWLRRWLCFCMGYLKLKWKNPGAHSYWLRGELKVNCCESWCFLSGHLCYQNRLNQQNPLKYGEFDMFFPALLWKRLPGMCFLFNFICDFFGMLDFRVVDSQICGFFSPGGDMMRYFHESL